MKLTHIQIVHAWLLARAYGHEWAQMVDCPNEAVDPEDIKSSVLAKRNSALAPGILCPQTDGELIIHTTGSGRLSWKIDTSGNVDLAISRPGGVAAMIAIVEGPERDLRTVVINKGVCHVRHLVAMGMALNPLIGVERTLEFVAEHCCDVMPD